MCVNPDTLELYILPSMWELRWRPDRLKRMIIAICKMFSEVVSILYFDLCIGVNTTLSLAIEFYV